jgi:hypothetical protein
MSLIEAWALRRGALLIAVSVVAGCSQTPNRAPIEDRSPTPRATVAAASPAQSAASAAEAAKPVASTPTAASRLLHGQARRHADPDRPRQRPELERPDALEQPQAIRT